MCTAIALPNGTRNTFAYDGHLKRCYSHDSTGVRLFAWDGENVGLELYQNGSLIAGYIYEPAGYGNLVSEYRAGAPAWYHYDGQGTTDRITRLNQTIIVNFVHSAFGVRVAVWGDTGYGSRYRYLGRIGYRWEGDADSQQYYVRRRRYDQVRGRWISEDVLLRHPNRYMYVLNSPTKFVDPSGRIWFLVVGVLATEPEWGPPAAEEATIILERAEPIIERGSVAAIAAIEVASLAVERFVAGRLSRGAREDTKCRRKCLKEHPHLTACTQNPIVDDYRIAAGGPTLEERDLVDRHNWKAVYPVVLNKGFDPETHLGTPQYNCKGSRGEHTVQGAIYYTLVTFCPTYGRHVHSNIDVVGGFTVRCCPCCGPVSSTPTRECKNLHRSSAWRKPWDAQRGPKPPNWTSHGWTLPWKKEWERYVR